MMVDSIYNEFDYDETATNIIYCKLFPLIMGDFLSRLDSQDMMKTSNLVSFVVTKGSPTTQEGNPTITPIYNGGYASPGSEALKGQREAERMKGGLELEAPQLITEQIMGSGA